MPQEFSYGLFEEKRTLKRERGDSDDLSQTWRWRVTALAGRRVDLGGHSSISLACHSGSYFSPVVQIRLFDVTILKF